MKVALIFTNDWELFGDGSGDYFEIQHKPLKQMMDAAEKTGAKISVMAETAQQAAHKKLQTTNPRLDEIAESWENILKEAIKRGHDVQLHLHPQWFASKYDGGEWRLDMNNWSIGKLDYETVSENISKAKNYLEKLLRPENDLYQCKAFRAGAYYIQPEKNVIRVLKENGFLCDTSVTKGLKSEGYYDFTNAYSNVIPWRTKSDRVDQQGGVDEGLLEIPIFSVKKIESQALRKFSQKSYYNFNFGVSVPEDELEWARERDKIKAERYPPEKRLYKQVQKKGPKFYMNALLSKNAIQLDYDYLPASVFANIIKNIINDERLNTYTNQGVIIPIVASGHTKDMHSPYNFEKILKLIDNEMKEDVGFWTLSQAIDYWLNLETSI